MRQPLALCGLLALCVLLARVSSEGNVEGNIDKWIEQFDEEHEHDLDHEHASDVNCVQVNNQSP